MIMEASDHIKVSRVKRQNNKGKGKCERIAIHINKDPNLVSALFYTYLSMFFFLGPIKNLRPYLYRCQPSIPLWGVGQDVTGTSHNDFVLLIII